MQQPQRFVYQGGEHLVCKLLSCPYARPHTWWPVTGMPVISLRVNVRL
jgi:hypothetical protein